MGARLLGDRPMTAAERQAKTRARRTQKMTDLEQLTADLLRAHFSIREVENVEPGTVRFYFELEAPQSVLDALDVYCERQGIDAETYLNDIGTELLLTAARP